MRCTSERPAQHRRSIFVGALAAVVALLVVACGGGGGTPGRAGGDPSLLRIGFGAAPASLDPAKTTGNGQAFMMLAYDPLIYRAPDGSLQPRLATSWGYVGTGNTVFEITLRPGVVFSDGSPLDAHVLKANVDYLKRIGTGTAAKVAKDATVEVTGPLTVRLTLSTPNPELPTIFTQDTLIGPISGQALASPDTLATTTAGAGPYVLDPAETVTNDHYTYVPNPTYWNKAAVHYEKVQVRVIPNPNTRLAAATTGQVDVITGDYTIVNGAMTAGLQVAWTPQSFLGITLADRDGALVPALRDVRVRQAVNYAVDRQKITKALFGEYGTATEQIQLPGREGHTDRTIYPHDFAKARELLAAAGYPQGFTLPVLTTSQASSNLVVQAMADDLKQVGIQLQLTNQPDGAKFLQDLASRTYPAFGSAFGSQPVHLMGQLLFLPGGLYNPFASNDAPIAGLFQEAAAAEPVRRAQLNEQIIARLVDEGWFVPVTFAPLFYFSRSDVSDVQVSPGEPLANPVEWRPAQP